MQTVTLSTSAVDSKDDKQPVTDSYSFTISQRTPGSGLLESGLCRHNLPDFVRNKFAGGVINGWQISGITQVQSSQNLTGKRTQTFGWP